MASIPPRQRLPGKRRWLPPRQWTSRGFVGSPIGFIKDKSAEWAAKESDMAKPTIIVLYFRRWDDGQPYTLILDYCEDCWKRDYVVAFADHVAFF
jgi:hypothetical protein